MMNMLNLKIILKKVIQGNKKTVIYIAKLIIYLFKLKRYTCEII